MSNSSLIFLLFPFFPFPLSQTGNLGFTFNGVILEPWKSPIFQNGNWLVDEIPLISQVGINLNLQIYLGERIHWLEILYTQCPHQFLRPGFVLEAEFTGAGIGWHRVCFGSRMYRCWDRMKDYQGGRKACGRGPASCHREDTGQGSLCADYRRKKCWNQAPIHWRLETCSV